MSLPRGVREVVVPSDQGRRGADVVVTDPAGDHVLPTFVATDGGTRARVRTHLGGDYSVADLRGVRTLRAVAGPYRATTHGARAASNRAAPRGRGR